MSGASGRPLVLVIIDGWGYRTDPFGNAIAAAKKPTWDALWQRWPHTVLAAAGEPVGLPDRQQGNSEVGHLNIGAGRIVYQDLTRINLAIRDGSFASNPVLTGAMRSAASGAALHLMGLVSPGGVHSSSHHLYALLEMAHAMKLPRVFVHAFTDGRDEPPSSAVGFLAELAERLRAIGTGTIASVSGRYYAMDRDQRWDRTERAYRTVVDALGPTAADPLALIKHGYQNGITDEFIVPTRIVPPGTDGPPPIADGDSVVCFNFRPDRARQLSHALVDDQWDHFERKHRPRLVHFVTFTEYEKNLPAEVAFPDKPLDQVLAEVVSDAGWRQFHTAETEKYAHVTYFLNGGREAPFPGEDRLLVPSPRVATYDLQPEMSARPVTEVLLDRLGRGDDRFLVVNFANPDMVGHTGVFPATVRAVEVVDAMLARIVEPVLGQGGILAITADHGNAELKVDRTTGGPLTAHTTSPVPLIVAGADEVRGLREGGKLGDIAPTLLPLIGLHVPREMSGDDLREPTPPSPGPSG
ncbi:MAG: 2,3-bisphosphoglycerate-independent phosphoglycerate mutase [Candidatus Dormibacteraeota bacterium]|nr:2,3-bisphosphoglycerate-independent phosphoglycerate mutase [Candidatus Dormibacteraeota bacterium]